MDDSYSPEVGGRHGEIFGVNRDRLNGKFRAAFDGAGNWGERRATAQ